MRLAGVASRAYWSAFVAWHARAEPALPYWPMERILEIQRARLRRIVERAYRETAFYREAMDRLRIHPRDIRTAADLALLPVVTKDDLAAAPEKFVTRGHDGPHCLCVNSSGTSGRSKPIYHDPESLFLSLAHGQRQRAVLRRFVGRWTGYREMVLARGGGVHRQMRDYYEARSWTPPAIDIRRMDLPLLNTTLEEQVRRINEFRPDVMRGYGSLLGSLFRRAAEKGLRIEKPKAVVYGADRMPEQERMLIESHFGVPVLSNYQAAEVLHIAFQCERRKGFHLFLDDVAVRVVDGDNRDVAPGEEGQVIVSNLTNRATVLLNYQLGDIVRLGNGLCDCGRTLPVIEGIEGRSDDLVRLRSGEEIHALVILEGLRAAPGVAQVQLVQEAADRFLVRAVGKADANRQAAGEAFRQALAKAAGGEVFVEVDWAEEIPAGPGGKVKAVISNWNGKAG